MRNSVKRFAAVVLAICVIATGGVTSKTKVQAEESDVFEYNDFGNGTIEITKYNGNGGNMIIPKQVDGKKVIGIRNFAFNNNTSLINVTLPDTLTYIGSGTFRNCSNLKMIHIPNELKDIDCDIFNGCTKLENIEIPKSVKSIGDRAFQNCSGLKSVTVEGNVETIGESAFRDCTSLVSVKILGTVKNIGAQAFEKCKKLKEIRLSESLMQVGTFAFFCCEGLNDIYLGKSVHVIGDYAFTGCTNLVVTVEPGSYAEKWAKSEAKRGQIVYKVKKTTGTTTKKPQADSTINTKSNTNKTQKNYVVAGAKYEITSSSTAIYFGILNKKVKKVTIPNTVKIGGKTYKVVAIANASLTGCKKLKSITIGSNVSKIGKNAFAKCKKLTKIKVKSKKLKKVGSNALKKTSKKLVIKAPKKKIKKYKKLFKKKGNKTVKVK